MHDDQAPAIADPYGDDLAAASSVADHYANQNLLGDYHQACSANTRRRQHSELAVFSTYLAEAHVTRSSEALYTDIQAWRGISAGLLKGFLKWQLDKDRKSVV